MRQEPPQALWTPEPPLGKRRTSVPSCSFKKTTPQTDSWDGHCLVWLNLIRYRAFYTEGDSCVYLGFVVWCMPQALEKDPRLLDLYPKLPNSSSESSGNTSSSSMHWSTKAAATPGQKTSTTPCWQRQQVWSRSGCTRQLSKHLSWSGGPVSCERSPKDPCLHFPYRMVDPSP